MSRRMRSRCQGNRKAAVEKAPKRTHAEWKYTRTQKKTSLVICPQQALADRCQRNHLWSSVRRMLWRTDPREDILMSMRSRCDDNAKLMSRRMQSRCQDECEADVNATVKPMSRRHPHAHSPNESTHGHKQIDAKWKHAVRYVLLLLTMITSLPSISLAQYSITFFTS